MGFVYDAFQGFINFYNGQVVEPTCPWYHEPVFYGQCSLVPPQGYNYRHLIDVSTYLAGVLIGAKFRAKYPNGPQFLQNIRHHLNDMGANAMILLHGPFNPPAAAFVQRPPLPEQIQENPNNVLALIPADGLVALDQQIDHQQEHIDDDDDAVLKDIALLFREKSDAISPQYHRAIEDTSNSQTNDDFNRLAIDSFVCPITFEIPTDPVFCTLDNRIYERSAIQAHLARTQRSPFNQARLGLGQTSTDVLRKINGLDEFFVRLREMDTEVENEATPRHN